MSTPTPSETVPDVKVYALNKVFNDCNIKNRVMGYVDKVYMPTHENRKIRKAFRNQLYDTIKAENKFIMEQLRIVEKKQSIRKRRQKEYKPTDYVKFCRMVQQQNPKPDVVGKIQEMWRERRKTLSQDPLPELPKTDTEKITDEELGVIWDYVSSDDEW